MPSLSVTTAKYKQYHIIPVVLVVVVFELCAKMTMVVGNFSSLVLGFSVGLRGCDGACSCCRRLEGDGFGWWLCGARYQLIWTNLQVSLADSCGPLCCWCDKDACVYVSVASYELLFRWSVITSLAGTMMLHPRGRSQWKSFTERTISIKPMILYVGQHRSFFLVSEHRAEAAMEVIKIEVYVWWTGEENERGVWQVG